VKWQRRGNYCDGTRFRMPAVRGAVWRDAAGHRRVFLVNISGKTQTFTYSDGMSRKTVTLAPRRVVLW